MDDDGMKIFLHTLGEVMKLELNQVNETSKNITAFIQVVAEAANETVKNIDWEGIWRSMSTLADILASIPKDIKETAFFQKVDKFAKDDKYSLTYEKIEWFLKDIRNEVLIEAPDKDSQTELSKYITQIEEDSALGIREKIIVLLAHIEALIYETLNHEKTPHEKVKIKVQKIAVANNKGMSAESLSKVYVYGICSIVFANTDSFDIPIDKRIPFRNNILHNGILSYSDGDLKTAYEVLTDFVDALVVMKKWIPEISCEEHTDSSSGT